MPMRVLFFIVFSFFSVILPSASQDRLNSGPPTMEQAISNNLRMLSHVRENPEEKTQALERLREKLTARGLTDIDAKLADIGKIFDEASVMDDASFEQNKRQLVMRILSKLRGDKQVPATAASPVSAKEVIPWIDVHDHFIGRADFTNAAQEALAAMKEGGTTMMIIMPPPNDGVRPASDCDSFASAIRSQSPHFAFLGGGSILNAMIMQTPNPNAVNAALRSQFEKKAENILKMGASGFGEMAAHHLSLHGASHPYETVPADHPLFLLLADIAARHDVPIDIHFDVVTEDIKTPETLLESPNNPERLSANLAAFERLLVHNAKAKIVWAHAGSDNIGHWTTELSRKMLEKHPNLYMSLRLGPGLSPENFPLTPDGSLKPEWLQLFKDFPGRFVIGDDQFFMGKLTKTGSIAGELHNKAPLCRQLTSVFLKALPPDLARKIATENAIALYKLKK